MVVVRREMVKDRKKAHDDLRLAEFARYDWRRCVAVEELFFRDLGLLQTNLEYQVYFHLHTPDEIVPAQVVVGFISTFRHHMPILASSAFRRWAGSLTLVLGRLLEPITWELFLDLMGKVVSSLFWQIRADEVKTQSAERRLVLCRRGSKAARVLCRGLKRL